MTITPSHPATSLARVLGAALLAAPLAVGAAGLGRAHAATTPAPALTQLLPAHQGVSGYAHTTNSVAVSGNTAVVGAIGDRAAYVFVKTTTGWAQQARLADPDGNASDLFGAAVAIHGDTILVGDPAHVATDCNATPNQQTGAVFQFDRSGTSWKETATIGCSHAGDKLGAAVAFDGADAVLGAPGANGNTGVAYLWHEITPGDWQQQQVLQARESGPNDAFGTAVSLDGATALVGAPHTPVAFQSAGAPPVTVMGAGASYAFVRTGQPIKSGNAWAEQAVLVAPRFTTGTAFGTAVSLDGNLALIGAPFDKNGAGVGAAYLSTRTGTTGWGVPVALPTPAGANQLGGSVSLGSTGGQTVAVIGDDGAQAAFVYHGSGTTFTLSSTLRQAGALGLGSAVATDGATAVLGAIYGNNYQGSAYAAQVGAAAPAPVNDTDPSLVYSGAGWGYYGGRPASFNDLDNDVHATTNNGDAVAYTFTGTGVSYISEKSLDDGKVKVYIDGAYKATVNAYSAGAHNVGGQTLYSISGLPAGTHTIKLVKKSGVYMLLDAFTIR